MKFTKLSNAIRFANRANGPRMIVSDGDLYHVVTLAQGERMMADGWEFVA